MAEAIKTSLTFLRPEVDREARCWGGAGAGAGSWAGAGAGAGFRALYLESKSALDLGWTLSLDWGGGPQSF